MKVGGTICMDLSPEVRERGRGRVVWKTPGRRKKGGVLYRLYDPRREEEKRRGKNCMDGMEYIIYLYTTYNSPPNSCRWWGGNNIIHTATPPIVPPWRGWWDGGRRGKEEPLLWRGYLYVVFSLVFNLPTLQPFGDPPHLGSPTSMMWGGRSPVGVNIWLPDNLHLIRYLIYYL